MPLTVTLVHAPIGGQAATLPEVGRAVEEAARRSLGEPVADSHVTAGSGMLSLLLLHEAGGDDPDVHRVAWDALDAGASAAKALGVPGLGHGLPVDALSGTLRGTGISYSELVLTERPAGPIVALLTANAVLGSMNVPLARAFVDPFNTPQLVDERLHRGFMFEVHDLEEPRKRMFAAPAELHDLLACLARPERFALKSIVTPDGATAGVVSSARRSDVLGSESNDDSPVALVRTGGDAPALEELLRPFGPVVSVVGPDRQVAPLEVRGLAFHVGRERLLTPTTVLEMTRATGSGGLMGRLQGGWARASSGWSER